MKLKSHNGNNKTALFAFRIRPELMQRIRDVSANTGITKGRIITHCLEKKLPDLERFQAELSKV